MNSADPLQQLHDIVEAQAVAWWPLAIGWWIMIIATLIVITAASLYLLRRHRSLLWKRQALQELRSLESRYFESAPDLSSASGCRVASSLNAEVNIFIKRVLSSRYANKDFRSQTAKAWQQTLDQELPLLSSREKEILSFGHYTPQAERLDKVFFDSMKNWLEGLH